jgi:hypothetical protein
MDSRYGWSDWSEPTSFLSVPTLRLVPNDYGTIQKAIDASLHGDIIVVATGTYRELVDFKGKNIVLRSTAPTDPGVVAATVIVGAHPDGGVTFAGSETAECVLAGFTITRGYVYGIRGYGTHATIEHNIVFDNSGHGILDCNGLIQNNVVSENSSRNGAGLYGCDGVIQNNLITNNVAAEGGGLWGCDGIVQNNTFYGNLASGISAFRIPPGLGASIGSCAGTIRNCIIWGNASEEEEVQTYKSSAPVYCCIKDWDGGGTGNIFTDPRFVDPENGDFRLAANSYCIDSGSFIAGLETDIEGNARGFESASDSRGDGSHFDIGAYESSETVVSNQPPEKPSNLSPIDGATEIQIPPLLQASVFSDADPNDVYGATQWQIDDDADFSSPELDTGADHGHPSRILAIAGPIRSDTLYHWRLRHMDNQYTWGPWSDSTTFRTQICDWLFVPDDFPTVQAAIDSATGGDEIVVRAGTYYENLTFHGPDIILRSLAPEDPEVVAATILDGSHSGHVVKLSGAESSACVLTGFTITHGYDDYAGGGIYGQDSQATIRYNKIVDNPGDWPEIPLRGGGLYRCGGLIEHNVISWNHAQLGGGLNYCQGQILSNEITWNQALEGAAIWAFSGGIHNNIIAHNETECLLDGTCYTQYHGGAIYGGGGTVTNNLFYGNQTDFDGALIAWSGADFVNNTFSGNDAAAVFYYCTGTIKNNIIRESHAVIASSVPSYCLFLSWNGGGTGNFSSNPRFVDSSARDYRLRPDSPCIDAGTKGPSEDFDGNARPFDSVSVERGDGSDYDIGCFEYVGPGNPNPPPDTPVNVYPPDGATGEQIWLTLVSSDFVDPATDDQHTASEWRLWEAGSDWDTIQSGIDEDNLTSFPISYEERLEPETTYRWCVRYLDAYNVWSEWSVATAFTTRGTRTVTVPGDYPTIQAAIDDAIPGDEIIVFPGNYREKVQFKGKSVVLRSTYPEDPDVVASTVIKGTTYGAETILFSGKETVDCVLAGFTITGDGRGITGNGNQATIRNNTIVGNSAIAWGSSGGRGGGLHQCLGSIVENTISGNTSPNGGAIYDCDRYIARNIITENTGTAILDCAALIEDNVISNNLGDGIQGSAIRDIRNNYISSNTGRGIRSTNAKISANTITMNADGGLDSCNGTIDGNLISGNISEGGAGLSFCSGVIINNIVSENLARDSVAGIHSKNGVVRNNIVFANHATERGGGVVVNEGVLENNTIVANTAGTKGGGIRSSNGIIRNNIVWGNMAPQHPQISESALPSYCCIQDWGGGGAGNISLDPRFADPKGGDYSLLPTSPCIDAGVLIEDLTCDFEGDPRPTLILTPPNGDGSGFDIGADEFAVFLNAGSDINSDWRVDFLDLFIFQDDWYAPTTGVFDTDLNDDEDIDALDLLIVAEDWQHGSGP